MSIFILTALRYLFLISFYIFIFYVIKLIVLDFKYTKPVNKFDSGLNSAGLKVVFETEEYFGVNKCFDFSSVVYIGRHSSNDIQINRDTVSKKHARIILKDHKYWLKDLNSLNGTYINNELIKEPVVLSEGDKITIGGVTFKFERCAYEVE